MKAEVAPLQLALTASDLVVSSSATSYAKSEFRSLRFGFADDRLPDVYRRQSQRLLYDAVTSQHLAPKGLNTLYFTRMFFPQLDPDATTSEIEDDVIVRNINYFAKQFGTSLNLGLADIPIHNDQLAPPGLVLPAFYASEGVSLADLYAKAQRN
ncbi:MAG: hypothetical protein QF464_03460, partial [Myxococcota bacterium]|nr:hypothetical protein [Myxococcota bacterium]